MPGHLYDDYFDLQLRVAAAYARLGCMPRSAAMAKFTNLRRRFGLMGEAGAASWEDFLHGVPEEADHDEWLERALRWHERRATLAASPFGCFSHDPPTAEGTVHIHFMPHEWHRRDSPLGDAQLMERRSELRAMMAEVRERYPNVRLVRGLSWLYNLPAYKRLFPQAYVSSIMVPPFAVNMNGSSTWGQVLDHRHQVKPQVRDHVLANVNAATLSAPWRAFPLAALAASCKIDCFER